MCENHNSVFFVLINYILGHSPRASAGSSLMRNFEFNFSERRTFAFSDFCMTLRGFANRTRRIDPKIFVLFRENR